ncbi:hypothetical protein [Achromobacter xylosoxidans]|uniref:hypothetical protein n=1 Tax=Alcaligenes xylosoxydans xylosoxydans TaxID=85698 RepID=UPI001E4BF457|nr:hypothetical protein [Achromobacter xylosoxidans]
MRETMDCGVLLAPGHETAMGDWVARDQPRLARVRLHLVHLRLPGSGPGGPDTHALAGLALGLRRYDHCVLPVAPASLAWTRMSLQQARGTLATPILLLVHDMTAPAIEDLLRLGAADFIASPYCLESLRVRLGRLARRAPLPGGLVEEPGVIYAAAAPRAVGAADVRPRVPRQVLQQGLAGMRYQPGREAQEPFRQAKAAWSMVSNPTISAWRCPATRATWRAPRAPPASIGGLSGR